MYESMYVARDFVLLEVSCCFAYQISWVHTLKTYESIFEVLLENTALTCCAHGTGVSGH